MVRLAQLNTIIWTTRNDKLKVYLSFLVTQLIVTKILIAPWL